MNRAFSKILILVILIILAGGGIFAWQYLGAPKEEVKDETVDWQTYRDEEYEFSIRYPKDWRVQKIRQEKRLEKEIFAFIRFYPENETWIYRIEKIGGFVPIAISIFNGSSQDYLSTIPAENIKSKEEITVNNISATKVKIVAMKEIYQYLFDVPPKGINIIVSDQISDFTERLKVYFGMVEISEENDFHSIFDQMLSTFRFSE